MFPVCRGGGRRGAEREQWGELVSFRANRNQTHMVCVTTLGSVTGYRVCVCVCVCEYNFGKCSVFMISPDKPSFIWSSGAADVLQHLLQVYIRLYSGDASSEKEKKKNT